MHHRSLRWAALERSVGGPNDRWELAKAETDSSESSAADEVKRIA